jgi:hypothetical protein
MKTAEYSLSLTLTEFWIIIFTERRRLRSPRERGASILDLCKWLVNRHFQDLQFAKWSDFVRVLYGLSLKYWVFEQPSVKAAIG